MSAFLSHLDGRWITDKTFMLLADLVYQSDLLGVTLTIPKGFVTDFASVPRVPIVYMMFGDRAHHESVVHDYLYQTHRARIPEPQALLLGPWRDVSRAKADKVFLEAMETRGKSAFVRRGMYWGVVLGGRSSYKSGPSRFKLLNE